MEPTSESKLIMYTLYPHLTSPCQCEHLRGGCWQGLVPGRLRRSPRGPGAGPLHAGGRGQLGAGLRAPRLPGGVRQVGGDIGPNI